MVGLWLVVLLGTLAWWYGRSRHRQRYWWRRGVPQTPPPSLFNPAQMIASMTPGLPQVQEMYQSTSEPLLGFYKGLSPVLMIRDPVIISAILKADFLSFNDKRRPISIDSKQDPLSQHLIGLTGERWKMMRAKLTPVFSSGKIKEALPLFQEALDSFIGALGDENTVDIYPATVRLVSEIILSYGFGLEKSDPERGQVQEMGLRSVRASRTTSAVRAVRFYLPWLFRLLGLRAFDPTVTDYFRQLVRRALAEPSTSQRAAFLNRLLAIAPTLPEDEREGLLAAQMFSFFVAGFETTCLTLSTCLYELAKHPEIVRTARHQLDQIIKAHGSDISYDALHKATYVTNILKESMRLYGADFATPRICTRDYEVAGLGLTIEKGTEVLIPCFSLGRDPKYHREPLHFRPERFSPEQEAATPGSYLPFGDGPRQCIAIRFSMLEMEYILFRLISNYDLELAPPSPKQLDFDPHTRVTHFKGKILIKFKKRIM